MGISIGSFKEFVKYDNEHPAVVTNILHGLRKGRLALCPIVYSPAEEACMQNKLRHLFAQRRYRDHFATFLHSSVPSTSRNINCLDIQTQLDAFRDGWVRSSPSDLALCGRADAMRVSTSTHWNFQSFHVDFRLVCMQSRLSRMHLRRRPSKLLQVRFRAFSSDF